MNPFNVDIKKLILLLFVLALPLLSINMEQKQSESEWFTKPFGFLASLSQEVFYGFSEGVRGTTALYLNLVNIKKHSEDVQNKNNELMARMETMQELQNENDRLRQSLDFKQASKMNLVAAKVIARDLVTDHNTISINKGTQHGLKSGQAVMTMGGALGFIFRPQAFTSHVMLITDRYSVVDGIVQRTRAHGIVEGKSMGACALKYVERTEDVKPGDLVVTGGLDNIFPKGLPVAIVEEVERKTFSVSLKVDLKPIIDPNKVEEVFVILNANSEDLNDKFALLGKPNEPTAAAAGNSPTTAAATAAAPTQAASAQAASAPAAPALPANSKKAADSKPNENKPAHN